MRWAQLEIGPESLWSGREGSQSNGCLERLGAFGHVRSRIRLNVVLETLRMKPQR